VNRAAAQHLLDRLNGESDALRVDAHLGDVVPRLVCGGFPRYALLGLREAVLSALAAQRERQERLRAIELEKSAITVPDEPQQPAPASACAVTVYAPPTRSEPSTCRPGRSFGEPSAHGPAHVDVGDLHRRGVI